MASAIQVAQVAWASLGGIFKTAVSEFAEAEKANTKLINSLVITGNFSKETFKRFDEMANAMQRTSAASEEQVKLLAAYSLSLGNTADRTEQMISAAQGLSVALGFNLDEAFNKLQATLTGSAGSLGKLIPQFKNMTEEQLKSGEAIKFVSENFDSFAKKGLVGVSGSLIRLQHIFGDLFEQFGVVINQGSGLEKFFNSIGDAIALASNHLVTHQRQWSTLVSVVSRSVSLIVDSVKLMLNVVITAINGIGTAVASFGSLKWFRAFKKETVSSANDVAANFDSIKNTIATFLDGTSASGLSKELDAASIAADKFKQRMTFDRSSSKEFIEQLKKINAEYLQLESSVTQIGKTEFEQRQLAAQAAVNAIGLRIQEVATSKDLLTSEKEILTQRLLGIANLTLQKSGAEEFNTIQQQTKAILDELGQSRLNEFQLATYATEQEKKKLDLILAQVDASSESGSAIAAAIAMQKQALQEKAQLQLDVSFEKSISKFDAISQSIAKGMRAVTGSENAGLWAAKVSDAISKGAVAFASAVGSVFQSYMKLFDPDFYKGLTDSLSKYLNNFPELLGSVMDGLIGAIDNLLANGPAILDNVIGKVEGFVSKFMERLPDIVGMLGDSLVKMVDSLSSMLPDMISGLMDTLPDLIDKIFAALNTFIERIPAMFQAFLEKLPAVLESFLSNLPKFIEGIFNAIPQMVSMLAKALPGLIDVIAKNIGPIIEALIEGILGAVGEIVAVISDPVIITKIAVSLVKAIINAIVGIVRGLVNGIGKMFKGMFSGAKFDGMESSIKKMNSSFIDTAKKMGKAFTKEGSQLFSVTDFGDGKGKDAADKVKEQADAFLEQMGYAGNQIKGFWDYVKEGWNAIIEKFTQAWIWVKDNIISPIADGIKSAWIWVKENTIDPVIDGLMAVFTWAKENVFDPIYENISAAFSPIMDKFSEIGVTIKESVTSAFSGVSDFFKNMFSGIQSLFKGDWSGFTDSVKNAFASAADLVVSPIKKILNGFIDIMNMMKIPAVKPDFKVLGQQVKFTLWNDLDLIPGDIARFAKGGVVAAAMGGSIPGFGTDTVPAMLTPGEFVMRREAVQSAGVGMMNAINSGNVPSATNQTFNFDVKINVDASSQSLDEGYVRQRLIPAMKAELKRASYAGELLISNRGIDK